MSVIKKEYIGKLPTRKNINYTLITQSVHNTKEIIDSVNKLNVKMKGKADFITDIDIKISDYIKAKLKSLAPNSDFFSEEDINGKLTNDCFILDPIDGTTNLIRNYNLSAISLAHYINGKIVYGIVYNPFTHETFLAQKGCGAFYNGHKITVSITEMKDSIIDCGLGCYYKTKENINKNINITKDIYSECMDIRRICSSSLILCYIATGKIDGYFEEILKPWDIAAGSLILTEAGGKITDYNNREIQFTDKTSVIASNGIIHDEIYNIIKKYK